jgi:hypothetical protein
LKTISAKMRQQNIHSRKDFQMILENEQGRSDRTGWEFSVLTFELTNSRPENSSIRRLRKVLYNRIRSCDVIGMIDKKHFCVILPVTPVDGARILADNVCNALNSGKLHLKYTVYSYQSGWINGDKEVLHDFLKAELSQNLRGGSVDNNSSLLHQPKSYSSIHTHLRENVKRVPHRVYGVKFSKGKRTRS